MPGGSLSSDLAAVDRAWDEQASRQPPDELAAPGVDAPGVDPPVDERSFEWLARRTPSRGRALDRMVAAGAVDYERALNMIDDARVTNEAWSIVRALDPHPGEGDAPPPPRYAKLVAEPSDRKVSRECWVADFLTGGGARELKIDPTLHRNRAVEFPVDAVITLLDDLASDGWHLQHVSEDRRIDDNADASFVTCARYLMARDMAR